MVQKTNVKTLRASFAPRTLSEIVGMTGTNKEGKMNSKKTLLLVLTISLFLIVVYGCATVEGPATKLQVTPGFVPQKTYNLSYEQIWDKVMSVLRKEKIMLAQISKENGIIQTDYIPGLTFDFGFSSKTYRYKYQIALEKINPSQTRVEISCKLEEKGFMRGGVSQAVEKLRPYEDVSYKKPKTVADLEYWLYDQIEKSF